ncbi:MAG: DUF6770 family protein, partial [Crocinitomicaceae bacterium]
MRIIKTIIVALLLGNTAVNAQQATIPNVLGLRTAKSSGTIKENGKLVGYYVFYQKERQDKKTNAYEVKIFDDNYNALKSFEITRPNSTILIEMEYNGEAFLLHFYDEMGYEFVTFDKTGKQLGSYKIGKANINYWDLQMVKTNLSTGTQIISIFPMGNKGFVYSTYNKNKKMGYKIVGFDNNAKQIWTLESDPASQMVQTTQITDVSDNVITATITIKKSLMTTNADFSCLLIDSKTGTEIKTIPLGSVETGERTILKSFVNEKTSTIMLVGDYFKPGASSVKDKSEGIYLQELSLKGEELSIKKYSWKDDIDKLKAKSEDPNDKDRPFYCFIHDVIITNNGHIFLIGEQYIKQASVKGILLGGGSVLEILVADMLVIEFDQNKKLVDFDLIDKKKTNVSLPSGYGIVATTILGIYVNSIGKFDYSFTSRNQEKDQFDVVYIDANRKEDEKSDKSDVMVGVISFRNGEETTNRVAINCESKYFWLQPAKPGFISVSEYFKKTKTISSRLEQIAY